jgi:hypothetical protein
MGDHDPGTDEHPHADQALAVGRPADSEQDVTVIGAG